MKKTKFAGKTALPQRPVKHFWPNQVNNFIDTCSFLCLYKTFKYHHRGIGDQFKSQKYPPEVVVWIWCHNSWKIPAKEFISNKITGLPATLLKVNFNCSKFTKGCKQEYILDWLSISVECLQIAMVKYITVLKNVSTEMK